MRERDDDAPVTTQQGPLSDGVGDTMGNDEYESSDEPYGETDFDDTYDTDEPSGTDTDTTEPSGPDDPEPTGSDDTYDTDGTYGDGETGDAGDTADTTEVDDDGFGDDADDEADTSVGGDAGDEAFVAQDGSPLEGITFLLDEVREALFGEDDSAAASPFDTDPAALETGTDLDLTGDGLVDRADLHEAASAFDFGVADGHDGHDGHPDDGVMDA